MALRNTLQSWGAVAKLLHWVIAGLIFAQFALGWMAVSWRLSPTKINLYVWHKSIGILILVLAIVRLVWRFTNPAPELPAGISRLERFGAYLSHGLLYGLIFALPLSGWIINSAANIPFRVFWWFPLPSITAPDKALAKLAGQIHFGLFLALAIVLVVHIAAALHHHFSKRNDVLIRMLPGRGRQQ